MVEADRCHLNGLKVDSVAHIVNVSKMFVQNEYNCCYDKVCKISTGTCVKHMVLQ